MENTGTPAKKKYRLDIIIIAAILLVSLSLLLIVTLSKELLDSLSEGEHTLAAVFTNGEISEAANFTIKAAEVEVKAPETGVYTAETSAAISSFVTAFMAATIAGAAVVIRKRA